jgi:hypothetical protein
MSNNTRTQEEKVLRKICGGAEKEKRYDSNTYHGDDELNDEKKEGKLARTEDNRSQWRENKT